MPRWIWSSDHGLVRVFLIKRDNWWTKHYHKGNLTHAIAMIFTKKNHRNAVVNHGLAVPASLRCDTWWVNVWTQKSKIHGPISWCSKRIRLFFPSSLFLSPDSHQTVVDDTWCTVEASLLRTQSSTWQMKASKIKSILGGTGIAWNVEPHLIFPFFLAVESFFPLSFDLPRDHFLVNSLSLSDSWMVYDGKSWKILQKWMRTGATPTSETSMFAGAFRAGTIPTRCRLYHVTWRGAGVRAGRFQELGSIGNNLWVARRSSSSGFFHQFPMSYGAKLKT